MTYSKQSEVKTSAKVYLANNRVESLKPRTSILNRIKVVIKLWKANLDAFNQRKMMTKTSTTARYADSKEKLLILVYRTKSWKKRYPK